MGLVTPEIDRLDRFCALVLGPDADRLIHRQDKYLPVANFTRLGCFDDGSRGFFDGGGVENDFQFHLREKIHRVLAAPIDFGVALLAAKPLYLSYGHSLDAGLVKGFLHLFQLEGFDNCFDFFKSHRLYFFLGFAPD